MRTLLFLFLALSCFLGISQDDIVPLGPMPIETFETSGLIFYNGHLITHNDSGNLPQLFEIDTTSLQIVRTVTISNAVNIDWEDLAQDQDHIYVADIGNNNGDREDLKILKISKADYRQSESVTAETIDFFYEDQVDFSTTANSDFDAEALFVRGDDLIVLTKQWQTQGTVAYRLPKLSGAFLAERIGSYDVGGMITGAEFDPAVNELYLIGYSSFLTPFFVWIQDVDKNSIFSASQKKINLDIGLAQTEAITKVSDSFFVSSEEFSRSSPPINSASRLFRFTLNSEDNPEGEPEEPLIDEGFILYRQFDSHVLNYQFNLEVPIFGRGIFDNVGRLIQFTPLEQLQGNSIDLSAFKPSVYHLAFFYDDKVASKPFVWNR